MLRKLLAAIAVFTAADAITVWAYWHPIERWFAYATGSYNCPKAGCPGGQPHNYNFNSGWGSIILPVLLTPLLTLAGAAVMFWWHNQCHVDGCIRYARKTTAAGDRACWKHNPQHRMSLEKILERHHLHLGRNVNHIG